MAVCSEIGVQLDPKIGVAAAHVRLEGFTDEALDSFDFGSTRYHVKLPGDFPAVEVLRHVSRSDVGDEERTGPVAHVHAESGEPAGLLKWYVRGVVLAFDCEQALGCPRRCPLPSAERCLIGVKDDDVTLV
jgi:hypothetical protein